MTTPFPRGVLLLHGPVWTFSGGMAGTTSVGVGATAASTTSRTEARAAHLVVHTRARHSADVPDPTVSTFDRRLSLHVDVTMPEPVIVAGKAVVPANFGRNSVVGTALTGVGHMRAFPDPDPVWNGSSWDVAPPDYPAGSHFLRWTVRDLPDPATFTAKEYTVGTLSANDGTSGQAASTGQWAASGGSDYAIPWQSAYPFKPVMRNHLHYGDDNSLHIETQGLYFNASHVKHMWADFGTLFPQPFTIIVVAIILKHPEAGYNWVLDSGQDPTGSFTEATRQRIISKGFTGQKKLAEAYGYRTAMRVDRHRMSVFNDEIAANRIGRAPFVHTRKPKMFFMVVNGANSLVGNYGVGSRHIRSMKLSNHGTQRLAILGRKNGVINTEAASNMVVFEIRAWDAALSEDQLLKHYTQLASTWKFHAYH